MKKQNDNLEKKRKVYNKCPKCGKETLVVSIFGSICSSCFYEEKEDKPKDLDLLNDKRVLMPRIYSFEKVRKLLKDQKEKILKEIDILIAEEMLIANKEGTPTSRLTSLAFNINTIYK